MAFVKGQSGNPGGRPSEARQQLQALLDECFPLAKRRKLIKLLVEDAASDDYERRKEARPLLMAYAFGKPKEQIELSGGVDLKGYTTKDASPDAWDDPPVE